MGVNSVEKGFWHRTHAKVTWGRFTLTKTVNREWHKQRPQHRFRFRFASWILIRGHKKNRTQWTQIGLLSLCHKKDVYCGETRVAFPFPPPKPQFRFLHFPLLTISLHKSLHIRASKYSGAFFCEWFLAARFVSSLDLAQIWAASAAAG